MLPFSIAKKNGFQWVAYRPLQWPPLNISSRMVSVERGSLSRGDLCPEGWSQSRWVSVERGSLLRGGICSEGGLCPEEVSVESCLCSEGVSVQMYASV